MCVLIPNGDKVLGVGDKVYDAFNSPNQEGTIKAIEQYLLVIDFGGKEFYYPYKNDGPEEDNHYPRQLSSTPYTLQNFTPIKNLLNT